MLLRSTLAVAILLAQVISISSVGGAIAAVPETAQLVPLVDIELAEDGVLSGTLTSRRGVAAAGITVSLRTAEGIVVETVTNETGEFAYRGLIGGMYQLEAEESATMCRVWAAGTAPPSAQQRLLLVESDDVASGQWSPPQFTGNLVRGFTRAMANPITATLVVGAAIGIPVAIHNANKDDDAS